MIDNLIDFGFNVAAAAVALLCLFEGTRRIGAYGAHRKGVLMFVASLAACAMFGGLAYQKHGVLTAALGETQKKPSAKPVVASASRSASPEKREAIAQAVARQSFKESGVVGQYIDRNGETKTFAPTAEDIRERQRRVAYSSQTEVAARNSLAEALMWLIAAVVAVFFGLLMSLDSSPPAKPAQEGDAEPQEPPLHR